MGQSEIDTEVESQWIPEEMEEPFALTDMIQLALMSIWGFIVGLGKRVISFFKWILHGFYRIYRFFLDPGQSIRQFTHRMSSYATEFSREMDTLSWVQLGAIIFVFGLFLIAPLLSVVWGSFVTPTGVNLDLITQLFSNAAYVPQWQPQDFNWIRPTGAGYIEIWGIDLGIILNSVYSATAVTAISVVLGTSFAFVIARYEFPGKGILRTLLLFPMLSTPFIGAMGIKWFLGANGFLNNLAAAGFELFGLEWVRIEFHGLAAIIIVQGFSLFSLVYLNAYSSFMGIDPSLEEQAENLGATGFKLFRSVTLPLAMPGIQAGAILTFILSIEDLGTP
ncbi:MAG: ABC transporter permease, partial [Candidatus Thorarchaeota archaeon]